MRHLVRIGSLLCVLGLVLLTLPEFVGVASAVEGTGTCTVGFSSGSVSDVSTLSYTITCTNFVAGTGDQGGLSIVLPIDGQQWVFPFYWCGHDQVNCGNNPFTNWSAFSYAQAQYTGCSHMCDTNTSEFLNTENGYVDGVLTYDDAGNSWAASVPYQAFSGCTLTDYVVYGDQGDSCLSDTGTTSNTVLGNAISYGYDGGTTFETTPCSLYSSSGPTGFALAPGQDYSWVLNYSTADVLAVVPTQTVPDGEGFTYPWSDITAPQFQSGTVTVDGQSFTNSFFPLQPLNSPTTVHIDLSSITTDPTQNSLAGLEAWCYTSTTGWVDWGNLLSTSVTGLAPAGGGTSTYTPIVGGPSPVTPTDDGGAFSLSTCLASTGLGLDPSSWVPGLVGDVVCGVKWLFIPTSSSVTDLATTFGVSSNNPTPGSDGASQWLGAIGAALATGPKQAADAIETDYNAGDTSSLVTDSYGPTLQGHTYGVSIQSMVTATTSVSGISTAEGVLSDLLLAVISVLLFFAIRDWVWDLLKR